MLRNASDNYRPGVGHAAFKMRLGYNAVLAVPIRLLWCYSFLGNAHWPGLTFEAAHQTS